MPAIYCNKFQSVSKEDEIGQKVVSVVSLRLLNRGLSGQQINYQASLNVLNLEVNS